MRQHARRAPPGYRDLRTDGRNRFSCQSSGTAPPDMIRGNIVKRFPPGPESAGFHLDIEFEAAAGVTALYGRSGSGKTLTLDAIAGFVRPDAGRILLDDRIIFDAGAGVHLPPQ